METFPNIFDGRLVAWQDLPTRTMIFGESEGMRGLWQIVERVASASVPILISGEKGTGKEILARFIHSCNPGPDAPFMKVTQPVPAADTFVKTAFPVEKEKVEEVEDFARNGNSSPRFCTLFVDEIGELSPGHQLELLQLIQSSRLFILGDGSDIPVALRVIATTTYDLGQEVIAGRFRDDLFSFLSIVTLRLSPLRERKEDIPQLANYFWQIYSEKYGFRPEAPGPELIGFLQEQDWPGNIRELENVMKRYVVLGAEGAIAMGDSVQLQKPTNSGTAVQNTVSLKDATREAAHALERKIILKTLQQTQWNRRRTARALNISYRALLYKIKEAGLLSEQPKGAGDSDRHGQKLNRNVA